MVASEDFNTWLKIAKMSEGFKYEPLVLGAYRIHAHGVSKRDMSLSMRYASYEFYHSLSNLEKSKALVNSRYAHCRYHFKISSKKNITYSLFFCVKHGSWNLKIKSIYMLILIFWKQNVNFVF